MRKNRKSSSHTHGNRIYILAFLLAGSFILGGCRIMKEKGADSKLDAAGYLGDLRPVPWNNAFDPG